MADDLREINKNIKELASGLKQQFDKLGSRVGSEISDIMTPEIESVKNAFSDVVGATTDSGKSLLKFFGAGLTDDAKSLIAAEDTADEAGKQTDLMQGAGMSKGMKVKDKNLATMIKDQTKMAKEELKISKREERRKRGLFKISKKSWLIDLLGILIGVPLAIIAAGIGLALAFIIQPFLVIKKLLKAAKLVKIMGGIAKFFGALIGLDLAALAIRVKGIFTGTGKIGRFFKFFGRIFKWIGGLWKTIKGIPLIGRILSFGIKGFAAGFSKIFWPIQIIISLIDFVKGFMATEGTILDKIQGGIKNVIVKFFEWPLKLLGRLWEWIQVKLFGKDPKDVKEGAAAAKMIEMLGKGIDLIFTGWKLIFGGIWDVVEPIVNWMKEGLANWDWEATKTKLLEGIKKVIDFPNIIKDKIFDFFGWDEEKINAIDRASIEKANKGAFDEKERRMRKGNDIANKQWLQDRGVRTAWQSEYSEKMYAAQVKANKIAEQIKDKEGRIITLPPPPDPARGIPDTPDLPTAIQNANLFAYGL